MRDHLNKDCYSHGTNEITELVTIIMKSNDYLESQRILSSKSQRILSSKSQRILSSKSLSSMITKTTSIGRKKLIIMRHHVKSSCSHIVMKKRIKVLSLINMKNKLMRNRVSNNKKLMVPIGNEQTLQQKRHYEIVKPNDSLCEESNEDFNEVSEELTEELSEELTEELSEELTEELSYEHSEYSEELSDDELNKETVSKVNKYEQDTQSLAPQTLFEREREENIRRNKQRMTEIMVAKRNLDVSLPKQHKRKKKRKKIHLPPRNKSTRLANIKVNKPQEHENVSTDDEDGDDPDAWKTDTLTKDYVPYYYMTMDPTLRSEDLYVCKIRRKKKLGGGTDKYWKLFDKITGKSYSFKDCDRTGNYQKDTNQPVLRSLAALHRFSRNEYIHTDKNIYKNNPVHRLSIDTGEVSYDNRCYINKCMNIECDRSCSNVNCNNQRIGKKMYSSVYISKSYKKGYGLFANKLINAGDLIIEYCGEVINMKEYNKRNVEYYKMGENNRYFMKLDSEYIIDAFKYGNCSRFTNHSCSPNSTVEKWIVDGNLRLGIFAKALILKGEEILYTYGFGNGFGVCYCKSHKCKGHL